MIYLYAHINNNDKNTMYNNTLSIKDNDSINENDSNKIINSNLDNGDNNIYDNCSNKC